MSAGSTIKSIIKLFPPELLCETSCLKHQLLYVLFENVLQLVSINIVRHSGRHILQTIVNSVHDRDNTMRKKANTYNIMPTAFLLLVSSVILSGDENQFSVSDTELFRRRVYI